MHGRLELAVRARIASPVALFALLLFESISVEHVRAEVREAIPIAITGMQAPGLADGVTFGEFADNPAFRNSGPLINEPGHLLFFARLQGPGIGLLNRESLWSTAEGLHRVVQDGMAAPGFPEGVTFSSTTRDFATFDLAGRTTFSSYVTVPDLPPLSASGLWAEESGQLRKLLATGDQAPGLPAGDLIEHVNMALMNDFGQRAATVTLAGSQINANNRFAVYSDRTSSFQAVARTGAAAPGLGPGVVFGPFAFDDLVQNNQGELVFLGFLRGSAVTDANDSGIWTNSGGSLRLVAREGQAAPGAGGAVFRNPSVSTPFEPPAMNDRGHVAFEARVFSQTGPTGIWADEGGGLRLVVLQGQPIPAAFGSGTFVGVDQPVINNAGQIGFRAEFFEPGFGGVESVWREQAGSLELIAREGQVAPGTGGETFFNIGEFSSTQIVLNNAGQVAFDARLTPSPEVTLANARGIWATDPGGNLQLVVREGDQIEVAPDDFRTISILQLFGTRGQLSPAMAAVGSGLNDFGQIAFHAYFTDNSQGIFVSNAVAIPEPSTLVWGTAGGVFLFSVFGYRHGRVSSEDRLSREPEGPQPPRLFQPAVTIALVDDESR
jgi:hypothetical protein